MEIIIWNQLKLCIMSSDLYIDSANMVNMAREEEMLSSGTKQLILSTMKGLLRRLVVHVGVQTQHPLQVLLCSLDNMYSIWAWQEPISSFEWFLWEFNGYVVIKVSFWLYRSYVRKWKCKYVLYFVPSLFFSFSVFCVLICVTWLAIDGNIWLCRFPVVNTFDFYFSYLWY